MITTRRSDSSAINAFESESSRGGVALLERRENAPVQDYATTSRATESADQARARMQDNLARLLNYDRYSEQVQDSVAVCEPEAEIVEKVEIFDQERLFADEDIRPTSTTMQFGDGDVEKMRVDMMKGETEQATSYRLNGKGTVVVVLYSLVVAVILALITINSGFLSNLNGTVNAKTAELEAKIETYNAIQTEIDNISSSEYIIDVAENQYGMVKGN